MSQFDGQVVLITGAARRIGAAMARFFASQAGSVVINYRSSRQAAEALTAELNDGPGRAIALQADVSRNDDVRRLYAQAIDAFGRVDVLINNAAVFDRTPVDELDELAFDRQIDNNLRSAYLCALRAAQHWRERDADGCIVNIADIAGWKPWANYIPYSISKAGVINLTQGLAKALAPKIRVNAIAPGPILKADGMTDEAYDRIVERLPLKRSGTPDDIVRTAAFLVQSRFVTGQIIAVDGGKSVI